MGQVVPLALRPAGERWRREVARDKAAFPLARFARSAGKPGNKVSATLLSWYSSTIVHKCKGFKLESIYRCSQHYYPPLYHNSKRSIFPHTVGLLRYYIVHTYTRTSLVPPPPLAAFFAGAKKATRGGLGTRLPTYLVALNRWHSFSTRLSHCLSFWMKVRTYLGH